MQRAFVIQNETNGQGASRGISLSLALSLSLFFSFSLSLSPSLSFCLSRYIIKSQAVFCIVYRYAIKRGNISNSLLCTPRFNDWHRLSIAVCALRPMPCSCGYNLEQGHGAKGLRQSHTRIQFVPWHNSCSSAGLPFHAH